MAVNYGFVQTALNTSTGTQSLSDSEMTVTPKLAIMWLTEGSVAGTDVADAAIGYGATDGTNQWAMSVTSQDNQASTTSTRILDATSCIALLDGGATSTKLVNATFDSFGTGSVTIDHQVAPAAGYLINVVLIGGADFDVLVGYIDPTDTDDGTTDITTTFQPEAGLFGYVERDDNTSGAGHIRFSLGFFSYVSSTITQRVIAQRESTGGGAGQPSMARRTDRIASYLTTSGTEVSGFEVTDVTSTTVEITTHTSGAASRDLPYIIFNTDGQGVWVGDIDSPTSTGDDSTTGMGFKPAAFLPVISTLYTSNVDANDSTAGGFSIGAAVTDMGDTDLEGASRFTIEDAADPTNTESSTESSIVRVTLDDGGDGVAASFGSFDSDGVTLNWGTVDGSNAWAGIGLAFAEAPASGTEYTQATAGSVSPSGLISKSISIDAVGVLFQGGNAIKQSAKSFAGAITPSNTLATVKTFLVLLAGSLGLSGAIAKQGNKAASGNLGLSGSPIKQLARSIGGTLTTSGALARSTLKSFAGALGLAGDAIGELTSNTFFASLAGSLSPDGTLGRSTLLSFDGSLPLSGQTIKQTIKAFAGSIAPASTLVTVKTFLLSVAGSLSPSGLLTTLPQKLIAGVIAGSGSLAKKTTKTLSGAISPIGTLAKTFLLTLSGAIAPGGSLSSIKAFFVSLSGAIAPSGSVSKAISKSLSGALSLVGSLSRASDAIPVTAAIKTLTFKTRDLTFTVKKKILSFTFKAK